MIQVCTFNYFCRGGMVVRPTGMFGWVFGRRDGLHEKAGLITNMDHFALEAWEHQTRGGLSKADQADYVSWSACARYGLDPEMFLAPRR